MLYVGGLRPRHVVNAYDDLGMEIAGTGYEFAHNDDYQRTGHYVKGGTLIYDDVTALSSWRSSSKASGPTWSAPASRRKYPVQKMGIPFRQMHSWDYSGPVSRLRRVRDLRPRHGPGDQQPGLGPVQGALEEGGLSRTGRIRPMPQSAEKILDHAPLFRKPEYQEMLARKARGKACRRPPRRPRRSMSGPKAGNTARRTFAREALTVNPAKACQPLGAVFVAAGFEKTLSFVHGSQGCVAYYRSHLSRHFKEPCVGRVVLDDRGRGGVRRAAEHDRRAVQRLHAVQPEDDRRLHHLHGRSHRRRPAGVHLHRQATRARCRPNSTCRMPTPRPSSAATPPAMTTC